MLPECSVVVLALCVAAAFGASRNVSAPTYVALAAGSMVNLGDVKPSCGDGYCTEGYPVCCDGGFCVSGGDKCCPSTTTAGNDMSCDQDELCCPGDVPACCSQGQYCAGNGVCETNTCSSLTDAYSCTSTPQCSWCCSDHRCVDTAAAPSCTTGPSITGQGSQCDRCYQAGTCGQCGQLEGCSWCCNNQQCIPNDDPNMCSVYQRINMTGNLSEALPHCSRCLGMGEGLIFVDVNPQSYESIFGIVGGLCVVIGTAILARYLLMRRMQVAMMRDLSPAEVHEVHETVTRYGFRHPLRANPRDADIQEPSAAAPDEELLVEDVQVSDQCSRCSAIFVPVPKCRWEGDIGAASQETKVAEYIVCLPCGHGTCLSCLGMAAATMSRFRNASNAPQAAAPPPAGLEEAADDEPSEGDDDTTVDVPNADVGDAMLPQLTSKTSQQLLLRCVRKCPKCGKAVADVLQVKRLIASVPVDPIAPSTVSSAPLAHQQVDA